MTSRLAQRHSNRFFAAPVSTAVFLVALVARPTQALTYPAPNLEVKIPTVHFSDDVVVTTKGETSILNIPYLAEYISGVYAYLMLTAGVVAGIMMVIGGFQYLTAGGDAGRVKAAKERITNAIAGVILTLGAYALLNTVSPTLVQLKGLEIPTVQRVPYGLEKVPEAEKPATVGATGIMPVSEINDPSFVNSIKFNTQNGPALIAAARDLEEKTGKKMLGTGQRGVESQAQLYDQRCLAGKLLYDSIQNGRTECTVPTCNPYGDDQLHNNPGRGKTGRWLKVGAVANPALCGHTSGKSVDAVCSSSTSLTEFDAQCQLELEKSMIAQGFCRLDTEPWHFEKPRYSGKCTVTWQPGRYRESSTETHEYSGCKGIYTAYSSQKDDSQRCKPF